MTHVNGDVAELELSTRPKKVHISLHDLEEHLGLDNRGGYQGGGHGQYQGNGGGQR